MANENTEKGSSSTLKGFICSQVPLTPNTLCQMIFSVKNLNVSNVSIAWELKFLQKMILRIYFFFLNIEFGTFVITLEDGVVRR